MTAMFSYTWSKALDENSASRGAGSDFTLMNPRCRSCDYSYAGFPHRCQHAPPGPLLRPRSLH
jgi:hypothetical protein